jgi:hypothetical protein
MHIKKVRRKKDMKSFVQLPMKLFGESDCYVPPIWLDERTAYYGKTNPILKNSDYELFLAIDENGCAVGRVLAYIDFIHNKFYDSDIGFFGAFECIDNDAAACLLISTAERWLKAKGMHTIRGPINPVAENWGFLLDSYDTPPVYLSPWNPEYYHRFFLSTGYYKSKDLLAYEADTKKGYKIPKRFSGFMERYIKRNPGISIRPINMHKIKEDVVEILHITNTALIDNWGFVPLEQAVMYDMMQKLKLIIDTDAVLIVEDNGKPVAFCLGFPDINILLKKIGGHMLPFGFVRFFYGLKKLRDYRLFALAVHPEYHSKALDALMYIEMYKRLAPKKIRLEANYILEDNLNIKNALIQLGMEYCKTYRIYEKVLVQK